MRPAGIKCFDALACNTILIKLCQNEQMQNWTKEWEFQIRVCDPTGTAILASNRPRTPAKGTDNN